MGHRERVQLMPKPFPFSLIGDTPENPEQAQNQETQERKQPRATVVLSPGWSIKSPWGTFGGAGQIYLLLIVWLLFECWQILLALSVFIHLSAASLWGPRPTQWWSHHAPRSVSPCDHEEGRWVDEAVNPPPCSVFWYCLSLRAGLSRLSLVGPISTFSEPVWLGGGEHWVDEAVNPPPCSSFWYCLSLKNRGQQTTYRWWVQSSQGSCFYK